MAENVGSLRVLLGLDAAEYTRGLTKAEKDAQRFAANTRSAILEVGKVLAGLGIAAAVLEATKAIISEASALNDLADATGSSVESLSRLNNQAKIAGADFATLQNAVLKLSQGMGGIDDDSNKVQQTLKLLGVTTKDPVEALQQVAVKLNTYADGVNKVGLAFALFGKQGPQFLATLKDIAELQDVGATVSKRQAEEAEALEKAYRRLSYEAQTFKQAVLSDLVPALRELLFQFTEGIRLAGGFFNALSLFSRLQLGTSISDAGDQLRQVTEAMEDAKKKNLNLKDLFGTDFGNQAVQNFQKQADFIKQILVFRAQALSRPEDFNARDQILLRKPEAPKPPGGPGKAASIKSERDAVADLIKQMERQLQTSLELDEVESARVAIYDLLAAGVKNLSAETQAYIVDIAEQLKFTREQKKAQEEARRAAEEDARTRQRMADNIAHSIEGFKREAEGIRDGNESIHEQIILLRGGETALLAYTQAKLAKAAAEKDDLAASLLAAGGTQKEADGLRDIATALRERAKLVDEMNLAKKLKEEAESLQQVKNLFSDVLVDPLVDFINGTKSAKDAFRALVDDLTRQLARIAVQDVANSIFGGNNKAGPDVFGWLSKLLGGGGGIGKAAGAAGDVTGAAALAAPAASLSAAGATLTGAGGLLDGSGALLTSAGTLITTAATALLGSAAAISAAAAAMAASSAASAAGGLFKLASAYQGPPFGTAASGTTWARGGRYLVGELGIPEIVDLPPGTRVTPKNMAGNVYNSRSVGDVIINIPGGTTASPRQIRNAARDGVMTAIRDR